MLHDRLDELGVADNTVVFRSTDNGAEIVGQKHDYPAGVKLMHTRLTELCGL